MISKIAGVKFYFLKYCISILSSCRANNGHACRTQMLQYHSAIVEIKYTSLLCIHVSYCLHNNSYKMKIKHMLEYKIYVGNIEIINNYVMYFM